MAIEGGLKCIKLLMCIFNFIFLIFGITLVILGIVVTAQFSNYIQVIDNGFNVVPIIIILLGLVVSLIAFFGCYGAMKENKCLINLFAACIILILLGQVICVVLAYVKQADMDRAVDDVLDGIVKNYLENKSFKKFLDETQRLLKCCGARNYTDYSNVFPNATRVPDSCCKDPEAKKCDTHFNPYLTSDVDFYHEGCRDKIISYIATRIEMVAVVALIVCFIEVLAFAFAFCMSRNIDPNLYHTMV
jgi:CD63 antigen